MKRVRFIKEDITIEVTGYNMIYMVEKINENIFRRSY